MYRTSPNLTSLTVTKRLLGPLEKISVPIEIRALKCSINHKKKEQELTGSLYKTKPELRRQRKTPLTSYLTTKATAIT